MRIASTPPEWAAARRPPPEIQPELFDQELHQAFPED